MTVYEIASENALAMTSLGDVQKGRHCKTRNDKLMTSQ